MEFFGSNFLHIRNTYVIPLVSYGIKRQKVEFWSFKEVITTKLISLNKLVGKAIEIEITKEDYYKALHCEIEMFINKSHIQYSDFINSKKISSTWNFVTVYYLTFFLTTSLFRFLNRGFIFLSKEQTKKIEDFSLAVYSTPISLDSGNYYFSLKEINAYGNVVLTLSCKGDSVHKSTWLQLESTLREFISNSDSEETVLYNLLLNLFTKFRSEYPSNLRNKLNYNGESSLLDFENSIPVVELKKINTNFLKELAKIDTSVVSYKNQMESIGFLSSYLLKLNQNLYSEYLNRSDFGDDFNKERLNYMKIKDVKLLD